MRAPAAVQAESMVSGMGPEFAVPFAPLEAPQVQVDFDPLEPVEACFLEACDDLWRMEAELARAVLVSVTGVRPEADLASTAEVLHTEFDIGPEDMYIRPFFPEDFLVLCREVAVRDCMVRAVWASSSWFDLSLRPWIRQAQATAAFPPLPHAYLSEGSARPRVEPEDGECHPTRPWLRRWCG